MLRLRLNYNKRVKYMYSTPQLPNYIRTPWFPRKNPERVNHPRGVVKGGLCNDLYTVYTGGEGSKVIDQSHTGSGEAVRNYFRCFFLIIPDKGNGQVLGVGLILNLTVDVWNG